MDILLGCFGIACLFGSKLHLKNPNKNYISRDTTVQINGLFVFLVLVSHFVGYLETDFPYSVIYLDLRRMLGQLVVTTFLFYSGYGVMESIKKKKMGYINKIPVKIVELILTFTIAILLFVLVALITGRDLTLGKVVASFVGWSSIGNSNWYLFDILLLYGLTYASYILTKGKINRFLVVAFIISLLSMVFLKEYQTGTRWYNTFLCYWAGLFYSSKKEWINTKLLNTTIKTIFVGIILFIAFFVCFSMRENILFFELHAIIFVLVINTISCLIELNSPILKWLGNHIFSIYILQRIPMILGEYWGLADKNVFLYFAFSLVACFFVANIFDKCTKSLTKRIF